MAISHRHQSFNYPEYVSPLPADELIKMGVMKQQLYDQGVEKVQKRIDELDQYGFDLVKEEDKQYFSQEMDKFIKAVNESAAKTDFSVLPNVRNILSIGRPLENDPLLLNAIQSSAEYRRRQAELSKMSPKDRSAANDWYYMSDAYDWISDKKVGAKLSTGKEYTPYIDPAKYISESVGKMKGIIESKIISENGFLKKQDVEKLTEQRLREWMENSLPASVVNQIRIDAEFKAKDVSPEEFKNYYFDIANESLNETKEAIYYLESLPTLTKEQQQDYETYVARKDMLEDQMNNIQDSDTDAKEMWLNNQYNKFITGQARSYAYRKEKEDWKANPYSLLASKSEAARSLAKYKSDLRKEEYIAKLKEDVKYGKGKTAKKPSISEQERENQVNNIKQKINSYGTTSTEGIETPEFKLKEAGIVQDVLRQALQSKGDLSEDALKVFADLDLTTAGSLRTRYTSAGYEYDLLNDDGDVVGTVSQKDFEKALEDQFPLYGTGSEKESELEESEKSEEFEKSSNIRFDDNEIDLSDVDARYPEVD